MGSDQKWNWLITVECYDPWSQSQTLRLHYVYITTNVREQSQWTAGLLKCLPWTNTVCMLTAELQPLMEQHSIRFHVFIDSSQLRRAMIVCFKNTRLIGQEGHPTIKNFFQHSHKPQNICLIRQNFLVNKSIYLSINRQLWRHAFSSSADIEAAAVRSHQHSHEKLTPLARHHGQNQIQDVRVRVSLPEKHCSTLSVGLLHPSCNAVWSISSAIRCPWQPICACISDSYNWTEGFRRGLSEVTEFSPSRSSCSWYHSGRVQEQIENCFVWGNAVRQALKLFLSFLWATFFHIHVIFRTQF